LSDYQTEAASAVTGGWTNAHVEIMNMWTALNGDTVGTPPTYPDAAEDQLVYVPGGIIGQGPTPVPLPATASLGVMMLGCVGLFSLARRARKTA
jgi:hypothetical protein